MIVVCHDEEKKRRKTMVLPSSEEITLDVELYSVRMEYSRANETEGM